MEKRLNPIFLDKLFFLFQHSQHFYVDTCQLYSVSSSHIHTHINLPECKLCKYTINHKYTQLRYMTVESIISDLSQGYMIA